MDTVSIIARILFSLLFIGSGFAHLTQTAAMTGYAQSRGLRSAKPAVQVSGVAHVLGGLSVLLGIWGDAGSLGLAILLVTIAVTMHAFWKDADPQAKQMEQTSFLKDVALAGGALAFFYLFYYDVLSATITGPLFN